MVEADDEKKELGAPCRPILYTSFRVTSLTCSIAIGNLQNLVSDSTTRLGFDLLHQYSKGARSFRAELYLTGGQGGLTVSCRPSVRCSSAFRRGPFSAPCS